MALVLNGDGAIAGLNAGGLPDASITQSDLASGVAGTGPAVFAYGTTNAQSISTGTPTKIILNAEVFDTNNCFDSTTNYRFTPNVAGYYQISFATQFDYLGAARGFVYLYKNGSNFIFQSCNTLFVRNFCEYFERFIIH